MYMYIICLLNIGLNYLFYLHFRSCILFVDFQDTEMQVVIVGAGRADLVAQTKATASPWSGL